MKRLVDNALNHAKILVVDDDAITREMINACLSPLFHITSVDNGKLALRQATLEPPSLILLDVVMEEMDGFTVNSLLKSSILLQNIPVIFMTSRDDDDTQLQCWEAGAVDFIPKPINLLTLEHRVKMHISHKITTDLLLSMSVKDALTNVANRRALDEDFPIIAGYCRRNHAALTILIADIDYFKLYNDTYGHIKGDDVLSLVAMTMKNELKRVTDKIYRYGGEEFVFLLPNCDCCGAHMIAEKMNQAIYNLVLPHRASPLELVTISIGGICYDDGKLIPESLADAINPADKRLYEAKAAGRNRYLIDHCETKT